MNSQESNRGGDVRVLKLHAPEQDNGRPTPVEIRFIRSDWLENINLPAQLGRPRCGQETRKTVTSAPRQFQLINA
jgi:hypothetical protein